MAVSTWDGMLSVGHDVLDADHAKIVALMDRTGRAAKAAADAAELDAELGELADAVSSHFIREEAMMANEGFPDLTSHHHDHEAFLEAVEELRLKLHRFSNAEYETAIETIKERFVNHICEDDARYVHYLVDERP